MHRESESKSEEEKARTNERKYGGIRGKDELNKYIKKVWILNMSFENVNNFKRQKVGDLKTLC